MAGRALFLTRNRLKGRSPIQAAEGCTQAQCRLLLLGMDDIAAGNVNLDFGGTFVNIDRRFVLQDRFQ